ncbi:aminodeoxychorismate synthase component I [Neptunicella sp. SCSIO 80796]|uniref:aminodeoxychorismate synthase component I n=1 Tax=Neptunicella plasticusilytica TaxID=3117012 RepID=UPI003A4E1284
MNVEQLAISADTDICQLFQHFSAQSWSILLDSAGSQHQHARYDIMVAEPLATLTTHGDKTEIWRSDTPSTAISYDDPMALIEQQQQSWFPLPVNQAELPFCGGALGYWGYDLGKRFEHLPDNALQDCNSPDMAVGIYSWAIIRDHQRQHYYLLFHPQYAHPSAQYIEKLVPQPVQSTSPFRLDSHWSSNMSQADYLLKFDRVQEYLLAGDCYQVNLAQRFKAQYCGDEWQAYLKLRSTNQAPFSAFIRLADSCILSISPERFLAVEQNKVQTRPIKGTRPRHSDPQQDRQLAEVLQQSEKDRAENLMIVDLLRNDLSKNCQPGSVNVPELFVVESFPAVHHLVSTVEGLLQPQHSALDLLRGAFPGGSITGAPKIRAMQIIDELEPHRRNIYCGSIGYLSISGHMDTSICIRTLLCENQQIYCWAGGGLVVDSDGHQEYQETLDKVAKILPVLTD